MAATGCEITVRRGGLPKMVGGAEAPPHSGSSGSMLFLFRATSEIRIMQIGIASRGITSCLARGLGRPGRTSQKGGRQRRLPWHGGLGVSMLFLFVETVGRPIRARKAVPRRTPHPRGLEEASRFFVWDNRAEPKKHNEVCSHERGRFARL
jgi:hypothetical protein